MSIFWSLLAFLGLLLGIAAPGLGWAIALIALIAASISVTLVKKKMLIFIFSINFFHLILFGPLSVLSASSRVQIWPLNFGLLFLVILPVVIAIIGFNKRQ